jgi:hypothetical protein
MCVRKSRSLWAATLGPEAAQILGETGWPVSGGRVEPKGERAVHRGPHRLQEYWAASPLCASRSRQRCRTTDSQVGNCPTHPQMGACWMCHRCGRRSVSWWPQTRNWLHLGRLAVCRHASDAVGENQDANQGNCDHAKEVGGRPPIGCGASRMMFLVWGHRPSPWPPSLGQRHRNACVPCQCALAKLTLHHTHLRFSRKPA